MYYLSSSPSLTIDLSIHLSTDVCIYLALSLSTPEKEETHCVPRRNEKRGSSRVKGHRDRALWRGRVMNLDANAGRFFYSNDSLLVALFWQCICPLSFQTFIPNKLSGSFIPDQPKLPLIPFKNLLCSSI